jgi:hypothetical protein
MWAVGEGGFKLNLFGLGKFPARSHAWHVGTQLQIGGWE